LESEVRDPISKGVLKKEHKGTWAHTIARAKGVTLIEEVAGTACTAVRQGQAACVMSQGDVVPGYSRAIGELLRRQLTTGPSTFSIDNL